MMNYVLKNEDADNGISNLDHEDKTNRNGKFGSPKNNGNQI